MAKRSSLVMDVSMPVVGCRLLRRRAGLRWFLVFRRPIQLCVSHVLASINWNRTLTIPPIDGMITNHDHSAVQNFLNVAFLPLYKAVLDTRPRNCTVSSWATPPSHEYEWENPNWVSLSQPHTTVAQVLADVHGPCTQATGIKATPPTSFVPHHSGLLA